MTHAHDRQGRLATKHPGSKRGAEPSPWRKGQRIHHRSGGHNGTVTRIEHSTGAFTVKYDEPLSVGGPRAFTYPSYVARNFAPGEYEAPNA